MAPAYRSGTRTKKGQENEDSSAVPTEDAATFQAHERQTQEASGRRGSEMMHPRQATSVARISETHCRKPRAGTAEARNEAIFKFGRALLRVCPFDPEPGAKSILFACFSFLQLLAIVELSSAEYRF
jgi:hypothetical protein